MAHDVESAFKELLDKLRSSRTELSSAASHRASIEAKLRESFGLTSFFRTGSVGNGTSISGHSDVDYFAVIPRGSLLQDSSITLERVASALRERFPLTPNIRVDSPGVQVPFGLDGAEHTEVVPVDETGATILGFRQFDMPDGNGGWRFSAPESHNAYVSTIDQRLGGKVKPLIRFLKAWRCFRNVRIRSFFLEIFAAKYADTESSIIYDIDVSLLLQRLAASCLWDLPDPRFPNDGLSISPCSSEGARIDALDKLQRASSWAAEAVQFRQNGRVSQAFDRWALVFNYEFPIYTGS